MATGAGITRCRGLNDFGDLVGAPQGKGTASCYKRMLRLSTPTTTATTTATSSQTTTVTSTRSTTATSSQTSTLTTSPTTTAGCEAYPVVTFVIDASTSIDDPELCGQPGNFIKMKLFAAGVVGALADAGRIAARRVRFSVIRFADGADVAFGPLFGRPQNASAMVDDIMHLDYTGGKGTLTATNVHRGLQAARQAVLEPSAKVATGFRGINNIVVLMTDGTARDNRIGSSGSGKNSTSALSLLAAELENHRNLYNDADIWTLHTGTCPEPNVLKALSTATSVRTVEPLGPSSQDALVSRILESTVSCTPTTTATTTATSSATSSATSTATTTTSGTTTQTGTGTTTQTTTGTTTATTTQCLAPQADVVFLIDRSESHDHFGSGGNSSCNQVNHTKGVVDGLRAHFGAELASGAVRVATVVFAAHAQVVEDFNGDHIAGVGFDLDDTLAGSTLVQTGFESVQTNLLNSNAGFRGYTVPLVLVIVTGDTLEHPAGAIASVLAKMDDDAAAAGGSMLRYVVDIRQAFQFPALDGLSAAASALLLQESGAKEAAAKSRMEAMSTNRVLIRARCTPHQTPASSAQLKSQLQVAAEDVRDAIFSPCMTTTTSTTTGTTTTATATTATLPGCNGTPDPAECNDLEVADCFNPVFGANVFATCLRLCPGSCDLATSTCHGIEDPLDCPTTDPERYCENSVSGEALKLKCPVLCSSCPADTSTSTSTPTSTSTSTSSTTTATTATSTTLTTVSSTTVSTTSTTVCSEPKADVVFLVERTMSAAAPGICSADGLTAELVGIADYLTGTLDLAGPRGGSDGDGVRIVGAVTYGGGLPNTAYLHASSSSSREPSSAATGESRSEMTALMSSLDVAANAKGQAGLIDRAFATARQQLLAVHDNPHAADEHESAASTPPQLRRTESNVPLLFVVLTSSGAFESSAGAVAEELSQIESLLPAGSTVARIVIKYEGGGGGGDTSLSGSGSGSGSAGSAEIRELLKREALLAFNANQFLQSIAAPHDAVFPTSCTDSVLAGVDFRAALDAAVDSRVPCTEPTLPTTAPATTTPKCTLDDDHLSCDALREAVCGSTNLSAQACSVLVLAPSTLCTAQSVQDDCPAMCGLC